MVLVGWVDVVNSIRFYIMISSRLTVTSRPWLVLVNRWAISTVLSMETRSTAISGANMVVRIGVTPLMISPPVLMS